MRERVAELGGTMQLQSGNTALRYKSLCPHFLSGVRRAGIPRHFALPTGGIHGAEPLQIIRCPVWLNRLFEGPVSLSEAE